MSKGVLLPHGFVDLLLVTISNNNDLPVIIIGDYDGVGVGELVRQVLHCFGFLGSSLSLNRCSREGFQQYNCRLYCSWQYTTNSLVRNQVEPVTALSTTGTGKTACRLFLPLQPTAVQPATYVGQVIRLVATL